MGNHSADLLNFRELTDLSLVNPLKFSKNSKSTTANIRMLWGEDASGIVETKIDSRDSNVESKLDSTLDSKTSKDSNKNLESSEVSTKTIESNKDSKLESILDSKTSKDSNKNTDSNNSTSLDSNTSLDSTLLEILSSDIDSLKDILFTTNSCSYLPKIYGIYKDINEIDFNSLPNSFVLKTNHDCGGVVIIKDKLAFLNNKTIFNNAISKLNYHLNTNYYTLHREYHYKDIEPRIFVEELLGEEVEDYRFHCFNANVEFIQIANHSHTTNTLFNKEWQKLPFSYLNPTGEATTKPNNLDSMINLAMALSATFKYIRVDLYLINSKVFIGELTFTPNGGAGVFNPQKWDSYYGSIWQ